MVIMINESTLLAQVSTNLAINFVNTQMMRHETSVDLLVNIEDLYHWATVMGIKLIADEGNEKLPVAVKELRTTLTETFAEVINGCQPTSKQIDKINQHLLMAPLQPSLSTEPTLHLASYYSELTIQQLLGKIAYDAATLITSPQRQQIKTCANEKCVLIFVDTSKGKKRRWCSMKRCGNQAKAANFYYSHKEQ